MKGHKSIVNVSDWLDVHKIMMKSRTESDDAEFFFSIRAGSIHPHNK